MLILNKLLTALDEGSARRATLSTYYAGTQPLAYLSPEARAAIGTRFGRMATNVPRLAVQALAERLRIIGFSHDTVWPEWLRNDMDQQAPIAHREALAFGESFVIVWADPVGRPLVTVESPAQVAVLRDPATRTVRAAVKRWELVDGKGTAAVVYEPDKITRLHSDALGALSGFRAVNVLDNPLGVVPVVPLRNADTLLGPAASEIDDLAPLVDGLNKVLTDMLTTSEYVGRPRRWATGIAAVEREVVKPDGIHEIVTVNPIDDTDRMMLAENPEAKFGQLNAAELDGYEAAVRVLQGQISGVSGLPPHYLGVHGDQPASADALRASEASLTAKAAARQATFGRAWEQVARLIVAVRTGADPQQVEVRVDWADPATRSIAQEADATVKLYAAGILTLEEARHKLGIATQAPAGTAPVAPDNNPN